MSHAAPDQTHTCATLHSQTSAAHKPMNQTSATPLSRRSAALLITLSALALQVQAQALTTPPADAASTPVQLETVSMTLQRDGSLIPYGKMNEILSLMQKYGEAQFYMEFKLSFKEAKPAGFAPKLALYHNEGSVPITIAADGTFTLPVLPLELGKDADLARNWKRGSASIQGSLRISTRAEQLTMGQVRRITRLAHKLRSDLLPWYLKPMFPQFEGVRICSSKPAWELEWRERGQLVGLPLSADPKDKDPDAVAGEPPRSCTSLNGQESWPDEARLIAPADTRLSVKGLSIK